MYQGRHQIISKVLLICLSIGMLPLIVCAQPSAEINKLIKQSKFKKTSFSILFYDLTDDKQLYAHNAHLALKPASNMKLMTTAMALDTLGSDFKFNTVFALHGNDLVVVASGDPLTGDPILAKKVDRKIDQLFDDLVSQLVANQITTIPGNLIIDATLFDDQRFHPSWPTSQSDKWYTAQVAALNFNNNCIDITFIPAANEKSKVTYEIYPDTTYVRLSNKATTVKKGKNKIGATRVINTNNITLRGKCRNRQTIYTTIDRPSAYFGHLLAEHLLKYNIEIQGKLILTDYSVRQQMVQSPYNYIILSQHQTSLSDVLLRSNQSSLNMAAECLFKTNGAYYQSTSGQPLRQGSWKTAQTAMTDWLTRMNVDYSEFKIDDGSGLSALNQLSANSIVKVLKNCYLKSDYDILKQSLATPESGTLKKSSRFKHPRFKDRIYAKTGYISRAWALSGYLKNTQDHWIAFSIIANNGKHSPRSTIDQIATVMLDQ